MANKEEVREGLDRVIAKFKNSELKQEFQRFFKTIQFVYPDIGLAFVMEIAGGEVKQLKEGTIIRPNVVVTIDSDTFLAILNEETDALSAFAAGKVKYKGAMVDLLKLQKLL